MIIALTATARAGKDSFYALAARILARYGITSARFAFADDLKLEIDPFITEHYGFSVLSCTAEQKELVRPFMLAHGQGMRAVTGGKYWIDKILSKMDACPAQVKFITDLRFPNEAEIFRARGATIINIQKFEMDFFQTKVYDDPPNEEEAKNAPILRRMADCHFEWPDQKGDVDANAGLVEEFFESDLKWILPP